MPFDAGFPQSPVTAMPPAVPVPSMFERAADPDPVWAAGNPDRMLAFLFVTPRDCPAVDALLAG